MAGSFPSGVAFDDLDIYNDILLIALPATGKLRLEDAKYLGAVAEGLGLNGVSLSVGDWTTFIPTSAYQAYRDGSITWRDYVNRWTM